MLPEQKYMHRCLQLAKNGLGTTYPNPLVGSVVVHNQQIIGEGWHYQAGEPHAEVQAIRRVKQEHVLSESTLYVNLEPCSHHGKTPPCADLIIEKKIPRVVVGCLDPNEKVAGRGIQKLQQAGIEVVVGVLEKESIELNRRFFTFHQKKRPYILLKWAVSQDGYIAPANQPPGTIVWLTQPSSRQLVHLWRSQEQAILAGTNTVRLDNPQLNVRLVSGPNPTRIILDKNRSIPLHYKVYDDQIKTLVITSQKPVDNPYLNTRYETLDFDKPWVDQLCELLYQYQIQSLIVEGGSYTLQQFINENLWDEARVFSAPINFGKGVKQPIFEGHLEREITLQLDRLKIYRNL